jgi:hypothetical protein
MKRMLIGLCYLIVGIAFIWFLIDLYVFWYFDNTLDRVYPSIEFFESWRNSNWLLKDFMFLSSIGLMITAVLLYIVKREKRCLLAIFSVVLYILYTVHNAYFTLYLSV